MSDAPTCTCGDLATLARAGLEGRQIDPCPIHRPDRTDALNSPTLTDTLDIR